MIRTTILSLALVSTSNAEAFGFNDITFWAGTGSNRAALVVDWKDQKSPPALAWGFRFDGTATGEDMLRAIVTSDPLVFAKIASFSFGTALVGLGYDTNRNGLPLSDGTSWPVDGWLVGQPSDGATAIEDQDRYGEGWNTGYWSYWVSSGSTLGSWTAAQTGLSGRILADQSWDGLSFAPGFVGFVPDDPVAAPEPGLLVGLGVLTWSVMRSRSQRSPRLFPKASGQGAMKS
ncbi:MAG: hypothetical protein KF884_02580 [Fimbriimonadaceae bacterium]|nr:hypothetical protein [Fimbriimonadaceae bacterium]QYK58982.1 MAG: hypothetical protein KF884_02580 [Fimbriimonadaceae bacterium]